MYTNQRLLVVNNPHALRISPELAQEIGLNESILLLQLEFWISISTAPEYNGFRWTYQSIRDMKNKAFPFWSTMTINRTLKSLLSKGYITEANFNKLPYDKTRWMRLGDNISSLKSISLKSNIPLYQNDTAPI